MITCKNFTYVASVFFIFFTVDKKLIITLAYSTLIDFFFHRSLIIFVIPGHPGIPGMRTVIPIFPGIKNTSWNGYTSSDLTIYRGQVAPKKVSHYQMIKKSY